jgi:hypothetical protein
MPGLDPGIHDFLFAAIKDVEGRVKPGHDEHYYAMAPHRQCSSRVSSRLISLPTASPNTDRITTPASS